MEICFRLKSLQVVRQVSVKAYFSGHYKTYRLNVQAVCDHKCRFVYAALAAPGGTNDIAAIKRQNSVK